MYEALKDGTVHVSKAFAKYYEKQAHSNGYAHSTPGVLVMDMMYGAVAEDLPRDVQEFIEDWPDEAIRAIMEKRYIVDETI